MSGLSLRLEASSGLDPPNSPSNTTDAAWTPGGAMGREPDACYKEEEDSKKAVEDKQPGQRAPAGPQWRRAMHVIGPRPVIFLEEQASP